MRDAIGGIFSLQIILAFILLINAYLAYSVNYTRAFRVKNGIISIIEESEGHTEEAKDKIDSYIDDMRYKVPQSQVNSLQSKGQNFECFNSYCIQRQVAEKDADSAKVYYTVVTFVNIDIPVLNKMLAVADFLQVKGQTKTIYVTGNSMKVLGL